MYSLDSKWASFHLTRRPNRSRPICHIITHSPSSCDQCCHHNSIRHDVFLCREVNSCCFIIVTVVLLLMSKKKNSQSWQLTHLSWYEWVDSHWSSCGPGVHVYIPQDIPSTDLDVRWHSSCIACQCIHAEKFTLVNVFAQTLSQQIRSTVGWGTGQYMGVWQVTNYLWTTINKNCNRPGITQASC